MPTASEIFALANSSACKGAEKCYYCAAPCDMRVRHEEAPPLVGFRPKDALVRCPASAWMCVGCALWRRKRVTALFMGGGLRDGQSPRAHSWLVTPGAALAIQPHSVRELYRTLLNPPCVFFLTLLEGANPPAVMPHMIPTNENAVVEPQTQLRFTVNGIVLTYSVYDLRQAVREDWAADPGVTALVRLFGRPPKELVPEPEHGEVKREEPEVVRKVGRPPVPPRQPDKRVPLVREVVRMSGQE